MSTLSRIACLVLALHVSACTSGLSIPFGQPGSAAIPAGGDRYIVFFKQAEIEAFGAPRVHYGKDRDPALQRLFLKYPHLMPPGCRQSGIEMISSGDTEGGKAFAYFRCKQASSEPGSR